jgi:hypothetical protein
VSNHRPDIPDALEVIVRRALDPHPKARYQDAGEMADDLRALIPEFKHCDVGSWLRGLCARKYELTRDLEELETATKEQVADLFARAVEPTDDSAVAAIAETREGRPGPTQGPVRTTVD